MFFPMRLEASQNLAFEMVRHKPCADPDIAESVGSPPDQPSSRPKDAGNLRGGPVRIFDVFEDGEGRHHIERGVREGE